MKILIPPKAVAVPVKTDLTPSDLSRLRQTLLGMRSELEASPGDRSRLRLLQVNAALAKMARGKYGTCDACAGPVVKDRLQATPFVRYCGSCAGTCKSWPNSKPRASSSGPSNL